MKSNNRRYSVNANAKTKSPSYILIKDMKNGKFRVYFYAKNNEKLNNSEPLDTPGAVMKNIRSVKRSFIIKTQSPGVIKGSEAVAYSDIRYNGHSKSMIRMIDKEMNA